jgi:hypothetical protein
VCSRRVHAGPALVASGVGLAVVSLAPQAGALELRFSPSAACSSEEITFRVENALAQPVSSIAGPTFHVDIARASLGYVGRVDIAGPSDDATVLGARRVTAASCDELVDTLALTLVLAIAGQREANAAAAAPAPTADDGVVNAGAAAVSSTGDALGPSAASSVEPSTGPRLGAFGALIGDAGSLPAFGLGVAVGVDLAWPSLELRVLGVLLPGAEGRVDPADPASPGAEIGLASGGLMACAPLSTRLANAELVACVGAELGRLSGHGTQIETSHSSATWWAAPRADLASRWGLPLPGCALEVGIGVAAPIWRDEFVLQGVGSVHRAAPVIGRASLGLRADFGP